LKTHSTRNDVDSEAWQLDIVSIRLSGKGIAIDTQIADQEVLYSESSMSVLNTAVNAKHLVPSVPFHRKLTCVAAVTNGVERTTMLQLCHFSCASQTC
jgi:hypothetical protein